MQQLSASKGFCPTSRPWSLVAAAQGSHAQIELRRYTLPRPNEMWELDDAPILSIVLPRAEGAHGDIMFDGGQRDRYRVGRIMLRPADIAMHSRGDGGVLEIVTCRFDPARFRAATGIDDWDAARLRLCAEITAPQITALSLRLQREAVAPGFASGIAVDALADLLMVDLARLLRGSADAGTTKGGLAPWQLTRIEEWLRESQDIWPTTQHLAEICGISRSHLSRSFAATTGRALSDYAAAVRMERAQQLVAAAELPISTIAETLGFASASAFAAAFRRVTGVTPRQFRLLRN